jgi:5S rRNA maturation endonuclease (ribonuclease M5)
METIVQEAKVNTPQVKSIYRYEDEKGELLYEVVRYEPKGFSQRRPDGNGGYINNTQGVRRVLYKMPQLVATPLDVPVIIVEGEKDVDRLISEGLPATTNSGGAGKWLREYTEYFRGRPVAILPDNDEAGHRHAKMVAESLFDVAAYIKVVEIPQRGTVKRGYDISDFLDDGHKFGEISILIDNAPKYVRDEPWTRKADVVKMSEIVPEDVQWLWPGRFPLGMITLLVGDPDLGKSYFSMFLATVISNGGIWPDGTPCIQAQSLILNAEDALANTVRKRLQALGANAENIIAIRAMRQKIENGECNDHFNIASDLSALEDVLKANPGVRLVTIDPLSAYFGSVDTFKESVVRTILAPLADLASRYNAALVCIMHLNKGNSSKALYRTQGSLAFPAAARAVWLVSNDPANPNSKRRFLINSKFNIGDKPSSLAFEIKEGKIIFENEPVNITAQDVLTSQSNIEAPERDRAVEWLKQILAGGVSKPSNEIFKLAEEQKFKDCTLQRARKELGIKCFPEFDEDGNKSWHWKLPKKDGEQFKLPNLAEAQARANETLKRMRQSMKLP